MLVHARAHLSVRMGGWVDVFVHACTRTGGNGGLNIVRADQYIENIIYRQHIRQSQPIGQ